MNWGFHIKRLREERHLTQAELAKRAGISRSYLAQIEIGRYQSYRGTTLRKLARGLDMELGQLTTEIHGVTKPITETPEQILEKLKLAQPISVPIYSEFPVHAGDLTEPVDYIYRARPRGAPKNIEGYMIHGDCLEPKIKDGDIIIVDRDGAIDEGDIVACLTEWGMLCGQLKNVAGELYLENNRGQYRFRDCQVASVVIEVIRRLK
ncbi:hypothetical protein ES703_111643 [subsurface metagenome]